ncbi:MAG: putative toxin-antitoxin system toxin component, PIN family [Planctomycetes bacterium]|nr:putative toxin-antitoxin system toxin component, PIN family [Planctomycetota bacterium]
MSAPRIVLDTNVIISGFLFGGPPARILDLTLRREVQGYTSVSILDEVRDVLLRPKFSLSPEQVQILIGELHDLFRVVQAGNKLRAVIADPGDDMILECALAADAELVISGDSHLLDIGRWQKTLILSPSAFLEGFMRHLGVEKGG